MFILPSSFKNKKNGLINTINSIEKINFKEMKRGFFIFPQFTLNREFEIFLKENQSISLRESKIDLNQMPWFIFGYDNKEGLLVNTLNNQRYEWNLNKGYLIERPIKNNNIYVPSLMQSDQIGDELILQTKLSYEMFYEQIKKRVEIFK